MKRRLSTFFFCWGLAITLQAQPVTTVDICIYGGTSAGIIAAYTARQLHQTVLIIEPGDHLGGLTTGGLGYTDIGNKYAITGLAKDFYRRIGQQYGRFEQWIFEPHIANNVFNQYISHAKLTIWRRHRLAQVSKQNGAITAITLQTGSKGQTLKQVRARMFIDCTYEGDLMARAGVSYTVGREANSLYNETYNGVQLRGEHQFPDGIDPYIVPGQPNSGLLWGISPAMLSATGSGDNKVQAYNFRICLSNQPGNRIPVTRPADYDSTRYQLLLRLLDKKPAKDLWGFLKFDLMPNHKTDINNNGAFSTDMIGINYGYAEASYEQRQQLQTAHENYTKGLLYFIGHDSRMPVHLRNQMLEWGYPKDEYITNAHWSPQLYVREARRMKGAYIMTQANCEGKAIVTDGVAMAAYTMDSHNCERLVVNGMVKNEGDVQVGGFGPYPISYRAIIPQAAECTNLLVPVCLSASHIAYGSIRMEPVFMALAQAAATAAVLAIQQQTTVQQVNAGQIQQQLAADPLVNGTTPEILVDNDDSLHVAIQGEWQKATHGAYGPSMLVHNSSQAGSVRFTPEVQQAGAYRLYLFLPRLENIASDINILIHYGNTNRQVVLHPGAQQAEGQTSGEWVSIGESQLPAGRQTTITVTDSGGKGAVAADALLLVPVITTRSGKN